MHFLSLKNMKVSIFLTSKTTMKNLHNCLYIVFAE